ncbi:type II toxin-antitoxin system HicB family antitoxin [Fulvimarina sp. 2208YS6-2-32]|uniref:Type II toxin-antitoxin system HicB family antitoxin n=1 Tax=Fulvimarina uroteuthidis TaxID=3098149 RepID=A0ABU5I374_9HYPH|nr:type II toxin-antitoxin system HicB family antitoxin [Fulvimarina sp. 2208YS6-2-32]MDY8109817.1 type II toxin-antitoxin system HicB family antitoxin [Fulvimarina sp. 2208YS6-2-32]
MAEGRDYTVTLIPQAEGGYTVRVPALPEVVTEGETREEALAMAREAIELVLECYRDEGREAPENVRPVVEDLHVAA